MRRRVLIGAAIAAACGLGLIAVGHSLSSTSGEAAAPIPSTKAAASKRAEGRLLAFTRTPRRPGNLLERVGVVGHSAEGRQIGMRQLGDPSIAGKVLVVGCIHGDECAGSKIIPTVGGCPDPHSNVFVVPNLNPDGAALGSRLNGRGVDLNRNFPSQWRPIGSRGDAQYSGPRPLSEPETHLAARIVEDLSPEVTIWFHQHRSERPLVRAWGGSVAAGRLLAKLARIPFRRLPWPAGTAPNWQNHRFPGSSSYVVELPPGPLSPSLRSQLDDAIVRIARWQAQVGED
jgi:protein MpaA